MDQRLPDISSIVDTTVTNSTLAGGASSNSTNVGVSGTTSPDTTTTATTTQSNGNTGGIATTTSSTSLDVNNATTTTTTTATTTTQSPQVNDGTITTTATTTDRATSGSADTTSAPTIVVDDIGGVTTNQDKGSNLLVPTSTVGVIDTTLSDQEPTLTHNCPDLRDRISIDISITTTTNNASNSTVNTNNKNKPPQAMASTGSRTRTSAFHENMAAKRSGSDLILSTTEHSPGTVVQVSCAAQRHSAVVLKCGPGGVWNATVPPCTEAKSLDTSQYPLYFAVGGGAVGLILLVMCILYCHLLRSRNRSGKPARDTNRRRDTTGNVYVDPYHVGERLYHSPNSPHYARSDIQYAKPVVYSTYLNPAFYEDAYERWRRQEQMVSEKLYDSPWLKPRGLQRQMETPGFKWSETSLKAIGESGFKKLPRAQLSIDHASVRSNTSIGSSRSPRDRRMGQSPLTVSCEMGMMRRYPSMAAHDPRPVTTIAVPGSQLAEDGESLTAFDINSNDGLTNF